jgi:TDG/mug DNA glycosylase family protein
VAILGIGAYRMAFVDRQGTVGRQAALFGGAELWVLPNPSGLNANHQLADLARIFGIMRRAIGR